MGRPSDVAFTESVKRFQAARGSRAGYARMEEGRGWKDRVTPDLAAFIAERDSFYLATATAEGQPYVQHRGGPPGFLVALDEKRLAFGELDGNRQYLSEGNLAENPRAFIFLMDYANRRRVKIWGTARYVDDDPALLARLAGADGRVPERALVLTIEAWDRNCPQHIARRFNEAEMQALTAPLLERIEALEGELAELRAAA